jgi:Flp pilus assembly protein TadD
LLACKYAEVGRRNEAAQQLEMAVAMRPNDPSVLYNAACTYGLLSLKTESLAVLKRAVEAGFTDMEWISRDTDLACLRDEPEFKRILDMRKPN